MSPRVTIAVPSFNQGRFLDQALSSIFSQNVDVEVFVLDGGSTDNSSDVIHSWGSQLAGWRSGPDRGQSAAVNEGIALGSAPYVCWLNSDDWFLPGGLQVLLTALEQFPAAPAVYGQAWNVYEGGKKQRPVWVETFSERRLAFRCIISQPATLIRRTTWEAVGGVNESLNLAMDYDLWWRLYKTGGPLVMINEFVAANRIHANTKTRTLRKNHHQEAIEVVRRHYGSIPMKWWLSWPYSVWFKSRFVV